MTTHVMLDIETLGTRPGCVVMSAAMVRFSDLASASVNLSIPEQQASGLEVNPETHAWWGTQDPAAWKATTENPQPLLGALGYIARWLSWASAAGDLAVWCHGATFDAPILGELFRRTNIATPWQFWNVRCTRTLYDLAGVDPKAFKTGTLHIALDDALAQTQAARAALAILMPPRLAVPA